MYFVNQVRRLSTSAFKSVIVNPSAMASRNPKTKIKDRNLCSIQFSLPDRWKPYHETKGKGSSPDKLNTTIFLIISTTSSQVPESILMKFRDDSFWLLSEASIQEMIIVNKNRIHKRYYSFY